MRRVATHLAYKAHTTDQEAMRSLERLPEGLRADLMSHVGAALLVRVPMLAAIDYDGERGQNVAFKNLPIVPEIPFCGLPKPRMCSHVLLLQRW